MSTLQQTSSAENKMGTMPIGRLLITMALPMMISMLVQALYNVVDSIFVSMIAEDALTAVSMAFPMQNLLIGVGSGLGVGMNALVSKALGSKDPRAANAAALHGIVLCACAYVIFLTLGLTIARWFFVIQGASDVIADYGHTYLSIVMCASFGLFAEFVFERLMQATGKTIYTMFTQGLGAITNIIMDPILIFGLFGFPKFGIAGAAYATVLGQILAAILAFVFNILFNEDIRIRFRGFHLNPVVIGNILYIGVPSVLMVAIGSIMTFCVNKTLVVFTSTAVAVFGVYFKLQSFVFMPIFGLNNGMVPIVAYNYGAGKPDRIIRTRNLAYVYAVSILVAAFAVMQIFPEQLLGLFNASESMLAMGVPALRTIAISFLFAGISVISSSFFQALGNGIYSMLVSFFRQLVFLVPLVFFLSRMGDLSKVWYAWPIAELVSVACCMYFMQKINRNILTPLRQRDAVTDHTSAS
ncbi:MAG: MATE family efflux transporter [Clostridiales bacterium]|nr:MATE family efflux transporter [Clostridiales bacterium]